MHNRLLPCFTFLSVLIAGGCSFSKDWRYLPDTIDDERPIYIVSHGWHTGIVIPGDQLGTELSFLNEYFPNRLYLEFGWGDKAFYQAKEITTGIALKAALWPSESVMHIVAVPEEPHRFFKQSQIVEVKLSAKGYSLLQSYLSRSFYRGSQGEVISGHKGLYGDSLFFQATDHFHLFNTCNSWTAKALDSAGVPISTFFTLTADSVMTQAEAAMDQYQCCKRIPD